MQHKIARIFSDYNSKEGKIKSPTRAGYNWDRTSGTTDYESLNRLLIQKCLLYVIVAHAHYSDAR